MTKSSERAAGLFKGFGSTAADYDIRVGRRDTGAAVRIRGDRPIESIVFGSIRTTVCPEPYIRVDTAPGKKTRWSYRFTAPPRHANLHSEAHRQTTAKLYTDRLRILPHRRH